MRRRVTQLLMARGETQDNNLMNTFKIASYNIHGWVDADMESNLERVAEVVNLQDPDILCLQVKCVL